MTPSELRGWHARGRSWGYVLHLDADHHLLAFWRRGLNLAPVVAPEGAPAFRASHYALQLKRARVLLRSVRYCNDTLASRRSMHLALHATCTSMCFVEVRDFNGPIPVVDCATSLTASAPTFRRNVLDTTWTSTIDGALVSDCLAAGATMAVRAPAAGLQHRAICLRLKTSPVTHDAYRWCRPRPMVGCGLWTAAALCAFTGLHSSDTDAAWRCWRLNVGGDPHPSTVAPSSPWSGGWAVGAEEGRVATLWRRQRQAAAEYSAAGDARADRYLAHVTLHIHLQPSIRLQHWREDMHTRSGASAWLKRRTDNSCGLQHVLRWDVANSAAGGAGDRLGP